MKYDDPKLRDRLAGEYVLGLMPARARARFERLMAAESDIQRRVAAWSERLAPIDRATPPVTPPARVWRAIEEKTRRSGAIPAHLAPGRLLDSLALWRGLAGLAGAVAAALLLYVALGPAGPTPKVVAVLADGAGTPAFIATRARGADEIVLAPITPQSLEAAKSFELWAIAGGPPKPLGLVPAAPGQSLLVPASAVATAGIVLAVSLEPEGGSTTGLPTGPVLFQGKVLTK